MDSSEPSSDPVGPSSGRLHTLHTLRHRDFRLLWSGQLIATTGHMIQFVAVPWHIYILTDSPLQIGLVSLFGAIPFIALSFVGGAVADRVDRKQIILVTQMASMLLTVVLVVTTATGAVTPWVIYLVRFLSGAAMAFDNPARHAIIPNVVPRNELGNAFTLNSLVRHTAAIVGPGIGGFIIGQYGLAATYGVNAVTFLATIAALLMMGSVPMTRSRSAQGWNALLDGWRYARSQPVILALLAMDALVVGLGSFRALLPVFARDVLAVGPEGLGLLQMAPAVGAVVGAVILGAMGGLRRPVAAVLATSAAYGGFIVGFGLSPFFLLSLLMLFGTGITDVVGEVQRATIVQTVTPDHVRGRVTGLHQIFSFGGPQVGQLWTGGLASAVGPIAAALISGAAVVAFVAKFATLPAMRRGIVEVYIPVAMAQSR